MNSNSSISKYVKQKMNLHNLKQYIHQHPGTIFDLLFIMTVGFLPLLWFEGGLLINGNEFNYSMSPSAQSSLYAWYDIDAPGVEATRKFAELVFRGFIAIAGNMGISLVTTEKIYFVFLFMGAGLSMYFLMSTLVAGSRRRLASLTGALFWMFNPFIMNYTWHLLQFIDLYTVFPLIFGLFIRGLRQQRFLHILLIAVVSAVFASHSGVNVACMPPYFFIMLSYLVLHLVLKRRDKREVFGVLKFTALLFVVTLAFNLWWLLPQLSALPREISASLSVTEKVGASISGTLELESRAASLLEILRLGGIWSFNAAYRGDFYYSYAPVYSTPIFQFIGFLIPLLAFAALLKAKRDVHILYFAILALTGLFMMKGTNPPLGGVFTWLFVHIPMFEILRHFQFRFGPIAVLGYAFLIGVTVSEIYQLTSRVEKSNISHLSRRILGTIPVVIIFLSLFVVYSYPMWTGEVIHRGSKITPSLHIEVPGYYADANDWLEQQDGDFKILGLPYSKLFYSIYDWEHGYGGADPNDWLFSMPTVKGYQGENYKLPMVAAEALSAPGTRYQTSRVGRLLALLNVKYVLVHRDTFWERIQGDPWWILSFEESIRLALENQDGIVLEKTFGKLDLYRNEYWQPMQLYAPGAVSLLDGSLGELPTWASMDGSKTLPALFFLHDMDTESKPFISDKANNFITFRSQGKPEYETGRGGLSEIREDFKTGALGEWSTNYTTGALAALTSKDNRSGAYSAELTVSREGDQSHMYREFAYDGKSPINLRAWIKVASHTYPSGAFIYLQGYDTAGVEKVRIMYYTYDNWDVTTSALGEVAVSGNYPFYALKVHLGDPALDTWLEVAQNPKDDFEARFPGVWDTLGLDRIKLDLYCWGDKLLTARYDDISITGISQESIIASVSHQIYAPKDDWYTLSASVNRDFGGAVQFSIDGGELYLAPITGQPAGDSARLVTLGQYWLKQGSHTVKLSFKKGQTYEGENFETGDLAGWVTEARSAQSYAKATFADRHAGTYAAELSLAKYDNEIHAYREFSYDGRSHINLSAWMKVVSQTPPSGAFIYLRGYDAEDVERVRMIYFVYDNWDVPTGAPKDHGWGPYYTLKVNMGVPVLNTWISVNKNPRAEFEARFPGVWETMNLTRIRVDLYNWGENEITSRYDDIRITGVMDNPINEVSLHPQEREPYFVPEVTTIKVNPTKYQVHVKTDRPFFLVLSQSYHTLWQAYYGDMNWLAVLLKKPIYEPRHFKVNGYANAWYFDRTGEYDITIYFKTQPWFYIGLIISGVSLVGCAGYIVWRRWNRQGIARG